MRGTIAAAVVLALSLVACAAPGEKPRIANPASTNCIAKGGTLVIQHRGDGGAYGVCLFEDNRQCEEWALLRGHCPVGGRKITGYVTEAARYCAITGGDYRITAEKTASAPEQGTCTLPAGKTCGALAHFKGGC